jgi:ubiquitin carboxyl-terminal hydrolase 36/42
LKYRLFGVTCHRGAELRFGHYTSYVRGPAGKWYHADDEDMTPVARDRVLGDKTAYLLSYVRIDGSSDPGAALVGGSSMGGADAASANGHASPVKRKRPLEEDEEDEADEVEQEGGRPEERLTKRDVPNDHYPTPVTQTPKQPNHTSRQSSPNLFSSALDPLSPASQATKFGYQPKPPAHILAPKPIPAERFYGNGASIGQNTTSPIARPSHPTPFAERDDGQRPMSKKQRQKERKRQRRMENKEHKHAHANGGKVPMPYNMGGAGFGSKKAGVYDRMQPTKPARRSNL